MVIRGVVYSALNEWIQECQKLQESVAERDKEIEAMRESKFV